MPDDNKTDYYGLQRGGTYVPIQPSAPLIYVEIGDVNTVAADSTNIKPVVKPSTFPNNTTNTMSLTRNTNDSTEGGTGGGHQVTFTFVDETTIALEAAISESTSKEMKFYYGYANGKKSQMYSAKINEASIEFTSFGARLTVVAVSTEISAASSRLNSSYTDMSPSEVVEAIAIKEGWRIGLVEPTKMVYEASSKKTTKRKAPSGMKVPTDMDDKVKYDKDGDVVESNVPKKAKVFRQNNLNSIEFINKKLVPESTSKRTGEGGYKLWFEGEAPDSIVNFAPQKDTTENKKDKDEDNNPKPSKTFTFKWGSSSDTTVISFTPTYNIITTEGATDSAVESKAIDSLTNAMFDMTYGLKDNPWSSLTGGKRPDSGVNNYNTLVGGSSYSANELERLAASMWYKRAEGAGGGVTAEMEIVGDPEINPQELISVIVINPNGLPHHTTGIYLITGIEETIQGGSYTTKLTLMKNQLDVSIGKSGELSIEVNEVKGYGEDASDDSSKGSDDDDEGSSDVEAKGDAKKYLKYALSLKGTPYVWGGANLKTQGGLDCSGFVYWCLKHIGRKVARQTTYSMNESNGYGKNLGSKLSSAKPGCSLVGSWGGGDPESHVMIYLGKGRVVHAPQPGDVIKESPVKGYSISRILDPFYKSR